MIKELAKRILYPHAHSSEAFADYLRRRGVEVGEGCYFFDAQTINVDLQRPHMLRFGKYVKVTGYVHILCHDYSRSVVLQSGGGHFGEAGETVIGDNVFIGAHAIVLMGSNIGANSIIGAGAVVSGSWPEGSVIAGNPAKLVCSLSEFASKRKERELKSAVSYANAFKKSNGCWPNINQMSNAFVWLYLPHSEETLHKYAGLFKLNGVDPDVLKKAFLASKPKFDSYQDFLDYCANNSV
ncbi:DapH/DapD/GlmU-related protein [Collinsella sp. AM18-10]|uniref:acyltransferase n=1 Tax=Collinsella sp. AM18-10 TaxID=2292028 RepID=UPI000E472458|nr:acyltransferase [Collinsella sp. AM18-10]RHH36047.1 acyltransferase [Collinsella sp. AM18-10]